MQAKLLSELPRPLRVGLGNAFFVEGRCSDSDGRIAALTVELGGSEHPIHSYGLSLPGAIAPGDYWWAIPEVPTIERPTAVPVALRAKLGSGREAVEEVGYLELDPGRLRDEPAGDRGTGPLVAICMTTHDPPRELLQRRLESIRDQTHRNWVCLISDDASGPEAINEIRSAIGEDERFIFSPSSERLGAYGAFERALAMVPGDVEYVALGDEADRWYRDRIESLLAALSRAPSAQLAHSGMRVSAPDGRSDPGSHQRNGARELASLLVANDVSGPGALFRREVLSYAWPFPPRQGTADHNHWIALCSLILGGLIYVDCPLSTNGVESPWTSRGMGVSPPLLKRPNRGPRTGMLERYRKLRARRFRPGWRGHYFDAYLRTALFARVLELRFADRIDHRQHRLLRRMAGAERGLTAPIWLTASAVQWQIRGGKAAAAGQGALLRGIAWRHVARAEGSVRRTRPARSLARTRAPVDSAAGSPGPTEATDDGLWLTPLLVDHFARDGSTLLMRLLATSPNIAIEAEYPYEARYFAYLWRWARLLDRSEEPSDAWRRRDLASLAQERDSPLIGPPPWAHRQLFAADPRPISHAAFEAGWREFSRRAVADVRERHRSSRADVRFYAEKHLNTWDVDLSELPEVRLIAMLRDPRDTYVSILAFNQLRGTPGFGQEAGVSQEGHLLALMARQRRRLRWIAGLLDGDAVPVVRYEALVADLPGVAAKLERRLGVSLHPADAAKDAALLRRHRTAEDAEASIGRWKSELDPAVAERITRELEPELRALGFDT